MVVPLNLYFFTCFTLDWYLCVPVPPEVLHLVVKSSSFLDALLKQRCRLTSAVNDKSGTCLLSRSWVQLSHFLFPEQIPHFPFYLTASCISFLFLPGLWSLTASPISSSLTEQIVCLVTCSCLTYPYFTSHLIVMGLFHGSVSPALTNLSVMANYTQESPFLWVIPELFGSSPIQFFSVFHCHLMLHSPL